MNQSRSNPLTTTLLALFSLTVLSTLATPALAATPDSAPNPRELPSLVEEWKWIGEADLFVLIGARAYVGSGRTLFALDAATGMEIWKREILNDDSLYGAMLVESRGTLALAKSHHLMLIDATSGRTLHTLDTGEYISDLAGPELVIESALEGSGQLLSIDAASGAIRARRIMQGRVWDLVEKNGVVAALVSEGEGTYEYRALGFHASTLEPVWEGPLTGSLEFEQLEGVTCVEVRDGSGERAVFTEIDVTTGELGRRLPETPECRFHGGNLPWNAEVVERNDALGLTRFRRNDETTGQTRWMIDLPCMPRRVLRLGDELLVDCHRGSGADLYIFLDWKTGAIQRELAGLANTEEILRSGELLIAHAQDRVVAFHPTALGPPASQTTSVKYEVHRILGITEGDDSKYGRNYAVADRISELSSLGPAAYPFIVAEIPTVGTTGLMAAAAVLEEGGWRDGASALAARLADTVHPSDPLKESDAAHVILAALGTIGGDSEIVPLAALLDDDDVEPSIRRESFAALASIGTQRSVDVAKRALAKASATKRAPWTAPTPDFLELVGTEITQTMLDDAEERGDYGQRRRLESALASATAREGERFVIVFPSSELGSNRDVWALVRDSEDAAGHVLFLGMLPSFDSWDDDELEASLAGDSLLVGVQRKSGSRMRFDLREAARDRDDDGLPDVVEARMRTNASSDDSDGDGVKDAVDPMPNAAPTDSATAFTPEQAVFAQFFIFEPPSNVLAVLVRETRAQWSGRNAPTISLTPAEADVLKDEIGQNGIGYIDVGDPMVPGSKSAGPGELVYEVSIFRGGLNAVGYRVVLRKFGDAWLMTRVAMSWIS